MKQTISFCLALITILLKNDACPNGLTAPRRSCETVKIPAEKVKNWRQTH